jgi:outer membrane lipoprotein LolB
MDVRRRAARAAGGAIAAALLATGCASIAPVSAPAAPDAGSFAVDGRLSAKQGTSGAAAGFAWSHTPLTDEISVTSPMGQTLAQLSGDAATRRYELRDAEGRRIEADGWDDLTRRGLGIALPVAGLASWIRGAPRPGAAHAVETDAAGRPVVLRQDGWEIVYAYADETARLPSRLRLAYPDVDVRIVIDRWR